MYVRRLGSLEHPQGFGNLGWVPPWASKPRSELTEEELEARKKEKEEGKKIATGRVKGLFLVALAAGTLIALYTFFSGEGNKLLIL